MSLRNHAIDAGELGTDGRQELPQLGWTDLPGISAAEDDDWTSAWVNASARAQADWRRDGALEQTVVLPWATASGSETLLSYREEIVVHTWDLGQATGQEPTWDDEVIAASYRAICSTLPPDGRTAMFARIMAEMAASDAPAGFGGAPFAEAVTVGPDARPIDRLVAYTGRTPA
ncbi:MAG: hypothetical protein NVSMB4_19050 [Acidimicrobiales bacterium]